MFGCLKLNFYLYVFISFCLPKWFTLKPFLSWTLELNVSSKNIKLNNCSNVSFPVAETRISQNPQGWKQNVLEGPPHRYLHYYRALVMNTGALCRKYLLRPSINTLLIPLTVALGLFFKLIYIQTWKVFHALALCVQTKFIFLIKHTIWHREKRHILIHKPTEAVWSVS